MQASVCFPKDPFWYVDTLLQIKDCGSAANETSGLTIKLAAIVEALAVECDKLF